MSRHRIIKRWFEARSPLQPNMGGKGSGKGSGIPGLITVKKHEWLTKPMNQFIREAPNRYTKRVLKRLLRGMI